MDMEFHKCQYLSVVVDVASSKSEVEIKVQKTSVTMHVKNVLLALGSSVDIQVEKLGTKI